MAEKLSDLGPLDNFSADEAHQGFETELRKMGRLNPKMDDGPISPVKKVNVLPQQPIREEPIESRSPEVREEGDKVTVVMGRTHDVTFTYSVDSPGDIRVSVVGGVSEAVISAATILHRASVRARDPEIAEPLRRVAGIAKIENAARLLELGRPDIIQANRELFSGNLPGVRSGSSR